MKKVIGPKEKIAAKRWVFSWKIQKLFFKQIHFDRPNTDLLLQGVISTKEGCFLLYIQLNKQFGIILVIVSKVIQFEKILNVIVTSFDLESFAN